MKFKSFCKFENTAAALEAATALCDATLSTDLEKFLKKTIVKKGLKEQLAVADGKLGNLIKESLGVQCVHNSSIDELYRGIRSQLSALLTGLPESDMKAMTLGLSHSLSRHKLKFSPDKVDTMIIQAIALLDELDKELNTYAMRVREWYGWHFPEMGKIVTDNIVFAKVIQAMGVRTKASETDLSVLLDEETEAELKEAAEVSMGTEISEEDLMHIVALCQQVVSISEYRISLFDYLKNRMNAIAPNLSVMVGELVGARLISHAGSLMNLAKCPASTVQILGAEKALFRALKTKHDTPKYGLIYHASLVGQSATKNKGKISRVLAGKTALSARVDALGDVDGVTVGYEHREKVENRLRALEGGKMLQLSGRGKTQKNAEKYEKVEAEVYPVEADVTATKEKKRKKSKSKDDAEVDAEMDVEEPKKKSKTKKDDAGVDAEMEVEKPKKKSKTKKDDVGVDAEMEVEKPKKSKSKKVDAGVDDAEVEVEEPKKKSIKKKKSTKKEKSDSKSAGAAADEEVDTKKSVKKSKKRDREDGEKKSKKSKKSKVSKE